MKVLLLSNDDLMWGAGRAAFRIHQGLRINEVDSHLLVQTKLSEDNTVISPLTPIGKGLAKLRPILDTLPLKLYPQFNQSVYSTQWLPDRTLDQVNQFSPDIINLHNITVGYIQIETLKKIKQPLVWTLHDMWGFTGGCHYSNGCDRYQKSCGACPQLNSQKDWDLSRWIWQRKAKAWKALNLTLVTPSHWLADCVRGSSLFQNFNVEVIANGLNTELYKPVDKKVARSLLNLPPDKKIVLFGATSATSDARKGFHLLLPALQKLFEINSEITIELVVFGASTPTQSTNYPFKIHYLGTYKDDLSLSIAYSAADVMLVPSVYEVFGQTASEAMACGIPVIAPNHTSIKEITNNGSLMFPLNDFREYIGLQDNDRVRQIVNPDEVAQKIEYVLNADIKEVAKVTKKGLAKMQTLSWLSVCERLQNLLEEML
jgi:glycosyltransferase involved in cell wall biosynthesis